MAYKFNIDLTAERLRELLAGRVSGHDHGFDPPND